MKREIKDSNYIDIYIDRYHEEKKVTLRRAQNLINTKLCLEVTTKHRVITKM